MATEPMGPRLTEDEINGILNRCEVPGINPVMYEWDRALEAVADAQLRKALWWAVQEIMEMASHMHELPHQHGAFRAGIDTAAEELQERARLLDIEPWKETDG